MTKNDDDSSSNGDKNNNKNNNNNSSTKIMINHTHQSETKFFLRARLRHFAQDHNRRSDGWIQTWQRHSYTKRKNYTKENKESTR